MTMREWAFGKFDIVDGVAIDPSSTGTVLDPKIIQNITTDRTRGPNAVTIKFYAYQPGISLLFLQSPSCANPWGAVENIFMQVEVKDRRASSDETISLTRLLGKTIAINAPDAPAYQGDQTLTYRGTNSPIDLFAGAAGANHVLLGTHGIEVPGEGQCMFPAGARVPSMRLGLDNVEAVFATLKGKVANKCVVWLGGCGIGSNLEFCRKAATASGCEVLAPGFTLRDRTFPVNQVDVLDRMCMPHYYAPGATASKYVGEFCATPEGRFVVPV